MSLTPKKCLLAFLGISILLIFFRFSTLIAFPDPHTLEQGEIRKFYPGETLSQQFIAKRDNLGTVQFLLKPPGIKKGDTVSVKLTDETCTESIREGVLEIPFLNSDNLYLFRFPRVEDSKGKTYCLLLSLQTEHKKKYLRFFTTDGQALSMRTVYRNNHWWQDISELNDRISQYKPWFLKDTFIGTIAILFVLSSLILIVALIDLKTEKELQ